MEPGGGAIELSGGSEVGCGENVLGAENGAPGDCDGLRVMPGFDGVSCLGSDKLATRITMITNIPVARNIFTIAALSVGADAWAEPVEAVEEEAVDEAGPPPLELLFAVEEVPDWLPVWLSALVCAVASLCF